VSSEIGRDRLREFIDLVLHSLNEDLDAQSRASALGLSRFHLDRLVSAAMAESPGAFRRRLLLERAAWQLAEEGSSVTRAAFDAGYLSVEGFSRAFARAFGLTPSRYRRDGRTRRVHAANGVHFHPPGGIFIPESDQRRTRMDMVDRLLGHDVWLTSKLIDAASGLPDEDLDKRLFADWNPDSVVAADPTIRIMLGRVVWTRENWTAAMAGRTAPENGRASIDELRSRAEVGAREFTSLIRRVRDRDEWDSAFVDALCEPPETFTYGGAFAHYITFQAYRRLTIIKGFQQLGIDVGLGDPLEWERSLV